MPKSSSISFAYLIAVDPVGDHHPQHVIHFVPQVAKGLEPHRLDALQQRIAVQFVAGDAVVESLLRIGRAHSRAANSAEVASVWWLRRSGPQ